VPWWPFSTAPAATFVLTLRSHRGHRISIVVARSVTRPIEVVTDRAARVAVGDIGEPTRRRLSHGELGRWPSFAGIRQYMESHRLATPSPRNLTAR